ncbi:MAG: hypothetical protein PW790_04655 [Parvibaculaceae bacterium]|nr:hypothetical protein [Parvibaculaceae bacterium]
MKKTIAILLGGILLQGCTSTVEKPKLAENQYNSFSAALVAVQKCVASGYISPETGAFGRTYTIESLNTWNFDSQLMDGYIKRDFANIQLSQADCNTLAMSIVEKRNQLAARNEQMRQNAEAQRDLENSMPKNTTCNTIGTQTFCNSY